MRLAHLRPDELTAEQQQLYDTINQGPRRAAHPGLVSPVGIVDDEGRLQGPFNAMLFHPVVGMALQELGRVLRFSGQLPPRAREIAILIVATSERSDFEWAAHAAIGAHLGLSAEQIASLARADVVEFEDHIEQIVAARDTCARRDRRSRRRDLPRVRGCARRGGPDGTLDTHRVLSSPRLADAHVQSARAAGALGAVVLSGRVVALVQPVGRQRDDDP